MGTIKEALTFDDVLILPKYSNVLPADTDISLNLTKKILVYPTNNACIHRGPLDYARNEAGGRMAIV